MKISILRLSLSLLADMAIAEIELSDEHAEIVFPKKIKIVKVVIGDKSCKNMSLAAI